MKLIRCPINTGNKNIPDGNSDRGLSQWGDTIIEVLICVAIIGMILGGAFATTRKSQLGEIDSREHSQALQLMQSQAEQMRAASDSGTDVFHIGNFCMYQGIPKSATSPQCTQDSSGNQSTSIPSYQLGIKPIDLGGNAFMMNILVTWDSVSGNNKATEFLAYKLYSS